jgi:2-aminoadipate transaminase
VFSSENLEKSCLADRLAGLHTSAIRELFKLLGQPGLISLAGGFPDAGLLDAPGLALASQQVFETQASSALQYGATEGLPALREQLVQWLSHKQIRVQVDDLLITTGSQQALDLIGKTLINPGDVVLVEAPTFLATMACFRLYGAHLVGIPCDTDGVDVEALEAAIIQYNPKLIYLIPSFSNPSGAVCSLERRLKLLELAARYSAMWIEDDPYSDLYFDEPPPLSLFALSEQVPGSREKWLYCGSLSKILSPGLRIGYLIAPSWLQAKAVMCKQFADAHTSTLSQAIAAVYLGMGRMPSALSHMRLAYAQRAKTLVQALRQELGEAFLFMPPRGGLFVWGRWQGQETSAGWVQDSAWWNQRAIARGVAFVPGEAFFPQIPDKACLRLSFATASTEQLNQGVKRLAQALSD